MTATTSLLDRCRQAIATVDDPEYPGVSIVDLGLVESLDVRGATATVGLIPTFSGCPALDMIANDVHRAVSQVDEISTVEVKWLSAPVWSVDRLAEGTQQQLAVDFTVAVQIGTGPVLCPRCGTATSHLSMFGPSRCRSVHRCESCREPVEVMRS